MRAACYQRYPPWLQSLHRGQRARPPDGYPVQRPLRLGAGCDRPTLGYPGITLLVALETFFPLMPTELILPLAGYLSAQGRLEWWAVESPPHSARCWARAASTPWPAGAANRSWPACSTATGASLASHPPTWAECSAGSTATAKRWWSSPAITPGLRTLISVPAGLGRMPLPRFWLYTALGSGLWNGGLMLAGRLLGDNWRQVEGFLGPDRPAHLSA